MRVTWFGHSAVRLEHEAVVVLIDPFISQNGKFRGTLSEAVQGATHVVLTHGHYDHTGDTLEICQTTGATLIATYELAMHSNNLGVKKIELANPGGTVLLGESVSVSFVNAVHSSSASIDGRPVYMGQACGVVIQGLGKTVYHMGDTDIFGDMALIEEIYAPKIGFVPIGDRFTMGAKTAALACKKYFRFDAVIPVHYGTFPIIDRDATKFVAGMSGQNVIVPEIGRTFEL